MTATADLSKSIVQPGGRRSEFVEDGGGARRARCAAARQAAALGWLLVLAAVMSACGGSLRNQLLTPDELDAARTESAEAFADADAVVLREWDAYRLVSPTGTRAWYFERLRHVAIEVRSEQAFSFAERSFTLPRGTELLAFAARTVDPSGEVFPLARRDVHEQVAKVASGGGAREYRFRFPQLAVGSVLEYSYVTKRMGMLPFTNGIMSSAIPTVEYRLDISGTKEVEFDFNVFNGRTDPEVVGVDSKTDDWRLSLRDRHIPAHPTNEPDMPHRSELLPWWYYRTTGFRIRDEYLPAERGWPDAAELPAAALVLAKDPFDKGGTLPIDLSACGDGQTRCRAEAVVDFVRHEVRYTGQGSWGDIDPVDSLLRTRRATGWEKAYLLHRLLRKAGVTSHVALVNQKFGPVYHDDFPSQDVWDLAIVQIPRQDGVPETLWVDPTCEHCRVGVVPKNVHLRRAAVISAAARTDSGQIRVALGFSRVGGEVPTDDSFERVVTWKWIAPTEAELELRRRWSGWAAQRRWMRTRDWSEADHVKQMKSYLANMMPGATTLHPERVQVNPLEGVAVSEQALRLPGVATEIEGKLVIPLGFLGAIDNGQYEADPEDRRTDLVIRDDRRTHDEFVLPLPPGQCVAHHPQPIDLDVGPVQMQIRVDQDPQELRLTRVWKRVSGKYPKQPAYAAAHAAARAWDALIQDSIVLEPCAESGADTTSAEPNR